MPLCGGSAPRRSGKTPSTRKYTANHEGQHYQSQHTTADSIFGLIAAPLRCCQQTRQTARLPPTCPLQTDRMPERELNVMGHLRSPDVKTSLIAVQNPLRPAAICAIIDVSTTQIYITIHGIATHFVHVNTRDVQALIPTFLIQVKSMPVPRSCRSLRRAAKTISCRSSPQHSRSCRPATAWRDQKCCDTDTMGSHGDDLRSAAGAIGCQRTVAICRCGKTLGPDIARLTDEICALENQRASSPPTRDVKPAFLRHCPLFRGCVP